METSWHNDDPTPAQIEAMPLATELARTLGVVEKTEAPDLAYFFFRFVAKKAACAPRRPWRRPRGSRPRGC